MIYTHSSSGSGEIYGLGNKFLTFVKRLPALIKSVGEKYASIPSYEANANLS